MACRIHKLKNLLSHRRIKQACNRYILILILGLLISCTDEVDLPGDITSENMEIPDTPDDNTQNLTLEFAKSFGGSQDDTFREIIATDNGGFAALGFSQSVDGDITDNNQQTNEFWLVKGDSNGNIDWSKTYGGTQDDRAEHLISTSDGGFLLAGYTTSSDGDVSGNEGFYDHWIVKLDPNGNIQWDKNYGFTGSDQLFSVIQTSDGGYFTAGFLDVTASGGEGNDGFADSDSTNGTRSVQHGVGEFWGHKLDANGNMIWRRYFGGTNNDRAYSVVETQDGGILMVGASESNDFDVTDARGSYDFWVVRLDNSGNLVWEQSYGGNEIDIAYAATATSDGGYLIAGDTRSNDQDVSNLIGSADVWLIKIDDQGNLMWEQTLGGSNFDSARAIAPFDSGFAIIGASRSADGDVTENSGQNDIWITTIDASGNLLKQLSIGGNGQDFGYGIGISDTTIYIAGDTQSTNGNLIASNGGLDGAILKIQ